MAKNYFLFAGEISGDLHGSKLIRELQHQNENDCFWGVGGPQMRKEEFACFMEMENFQVMGFTDVLKALPKIYRYFYTILDQILKKNPDAVILIDYPGFNLRLAKALRRKNYEGKIIQYISPTVWAHGKKRIQTLAKNFDLLLTIYPFEADLFQNEQLHVEYVGNPIEENIRSFTYQPNWWQKCNLPTNKNLVALFPGSRKSEVLRHLGQQLEVAHALKKNFPELKFILCCAHENLYHEIVKSVSKNSLQLDKDLFLISTDHKYDLMHDCSLALAKSGTICLELALFSVPTVVHYQLSKLNYFLAKYFLKLNLPYYCIVNILGRQEIYPEFISKKYTSKDLFQALSQLYTNPDVRNQLKQNCISIKNTLGEQRTHQNAVKAIQRLFYD